MTGATSTTVRRRDKSKRIKCTDCGKNIGMKKELVRGEDGLPYHLLCAGFIHHPKLDPCGECFTIKPCLCGD
jgi:hypothetical protein